MCFVGVAQMITFLKERYEMIEQVHILVVVIVTTLALWGIPPQYRQILTLREYNDDYGIYQITNRTWCAYVLLFGVCLMCGIGIHELIVNP